jgi:hypothetical protein
MIQKVNLVSNIEKYHLGDVIETVKWKISNNNLVIPFISPNQDLVGMMETSINLEDGTLGIFNTSALLKLLNIMEEEVSINVELQHKVPMKLIIDDSNFSLQYSLADPMIVQNIPEIMEPVYDAEFNIDGDFVSRFIKAKNALGSNVREVFKIISNTKDGNKELKFILGEPTSHSNKVEFSVASSYEDSLKMDIPFNSGYVKEILSANKGDLKEAKGWVSNEGLLKLEFISETAKVTYYLPKIQI